MGKNSKAKRDAKAKVKARGERADQHTGSWAGDNIFDDNFAASSSAPAQLFRRSCSECSSAQLTWMTATELADRVPEEEKARVREGIDMLGPTSQAWLCAQCGAFGIMA